MNRLLVIADDLTGSLDAGANFAAGNLKTTVLVDTDFDAFPAGDLKGAAVLVVNTESRHISPSAAAAKIEETVRFGVGQGFRSFFKKTDSTMRGNIGAELESLLRETGAGSLCYIPAHPRLGRITVDGVHYVNGDLLHQTSYADDPLEPIRDSHIREILLKQMPGPVTVVSELSKNTFNAAAVAGGIIVFDASSVGDLERTGLFLRDQNRLGITAGTAGFAEILAGFMAPVGHEYEIPVIDKPILIVNGSLNTVSLQQVGQADQSIFAKLAVPSGELMEGLQEATTERIMEKSVDAYRNGKSLLIRSVLNRDELNNILDDKYPEGIPTGVYNRASGNLGSLVAGILDKACFRSCMIIGGDTLMAFIRAMNIRKLTPGGEIMPGVVLSRLETPAGRIQLISKPGGYGEADLINRIMEY